MNELTVDQINKYNKKSVPQLLKLAEHAFNAYIRHRDSEGEYFICISCSTPKSLSKMHAGHYMSAGHNASVRFNEDNVRGQCEKCNTFLHGNLIRYRENLVKKIGEDKVKYLEAISRITKKWDRLELIDIIVTYKQKIK
jgi:hypothetical protein